MADKKLDDDEDDDDDLDAAPADEDDRPSGGGDDDEPDFDDDDEEPKRGKGKLIAIIAVAATLFLGLAGGGAYFFVFSGHGDDEEVAETRVEKDDPDDGSTMTISRNRRMMSSEELAQKGAASDTTAAPGAPAAGMTPPPASNSGAAPAPAESAANNTAQGAAPAQQAAMAPPAPQAPVAAPPPAAKGVKGKAAPQTPADTQGLVTPAATAAAFREIPVLPAGKPLAPPDPAYGESSEFGTLPRARGNQGVWRAHARPFDGPDDKPRVTIIITGLGLSRASTLAAMSQTPPGVTLAFDPYTRNLDEWLGLGRSNGHEALVQLPMEPSDFPVSDPGPLALLTDLDAAHNVQRLHQVLASATGYTGLIQVMGSKFAASEAALRPALEEMKKRGVLFVSVPANNDDRGLTVAQDVGVPSARVDLKLDTELSAAAIDDKITELERLAREKGRAVGIAEAYPVTLGRLSLWGQTLSLKEIQLAPASAIVQLAPPAAAAKGAPKH